MSLVEWAAIIGALAWTPHLIAFVRGLLTKAQVSVIVDRAPEIGFTTFGPIFNLRLAFAVENKDIVVSDLSVSVEHESGQTSTFVWQGITQQMGKMRTRDAGVMPFEKELSVLAIRLGQKEIEERFIRFQEATFLRDRQPLFDAALDHQAYLHNEGRWNPDEFLRSSQLTQLYAFIHQSFHWRPGKYRLTIQLKSPDVFKLLDNTYSFRLSPLDVQMLERNRGFVEQSFREDIKQPSEADVNIVWQWRYPPLTKVE